MSADLPDRKPDAFKYWAFICYSHSDEHWAKWLHRKLETYRVPERLVGQTGTTGVIIPKRVFPIFRDREELPGSANLTESIERALRDSLYLIVICSPRAVKSKWVDQEIRMFKSWGREDRVLCLVIEGEPNAATSQHLNGPECLPESVKYWIDSKRQITAVPTEPIAADARKGKDGRQNGFLKIAAGILGVSFEDLRQRDEDRRHKLRMTYSAAAAALVILLGGLSVELYFQKQLAVQAMQQAREDRVRAYNERKAAVEAEKAARNALEEQQRLTKQTEQARQAAESAADAERKAKDEARKAAEDAAKAAETAQLAEARATTSEKAAKANEEKIRRTLAISDLATATRLLKEDNDGKALAYLARSMRADPNNQAVIARTVSLLSQRNWPLQVFAPLKHDHDVKLVQFSPDGEKVVTVCDNAARIWNAKTGALVFGPLEHKAAITSAEFSSDTKWLLTASADNTAQVWSLADGKPVGAPLKHDDAVNGASFSADAKMIVTASQDRVARVWDRSTGKVIISLFHDAPLGSARFNPDGTSVVVATVRSYARVWDIATGQQLGGNMSHQGGLTSALFSPDGKWVATASGDRTARLWQAGTGSPVSPPLDHVNWITGVKFSPDSRYLATVSSDNTARVWEVPAGKPVTPPLKHEGAISSVNFSPNGRWLVTSSADGTARVWDAVTGQSICEPLRHTANVYEATFNHDGDQVVTASADHTARVWSVADHRPAVEPMKHDKWINGVAFSQDGTSIATVSANTAQVWDSFSGKPLTNLLKHRSEVQSCCFADHGKILLTGSAKGFVCGWDVATETLLFERSEHEASVNTIVVSRDGNSFFTASNDRTVRRWDIHSGKPYDLVLRHETPVKTLLITSSGTLVTIPQDSRNVFIWNDNGEQRFNLTHPAEVRSAAISPDGSWLATGADEKGGGCVRLWDVTTGKLLADNVRQDGPVSILAFPSLQAWTNLDNPRKWLLSISDKTARIWDLVNEKPVTEPIKHTDNVTAAGITEDGNFVVTASGKTALVWDAATGQPVCEPIQHDNAIRFALFSSDGNAVLTASDDKSARVSLLRLSGSSPKWLSQFANAVGGYQVAESGATELVADTWTRLHQLQATDLDRSDEYSRWARWFIEAYPTRTANPFTKSSLKAYVASRVFENTPESLRRALDIEPSNALALVKLARHEPNADSADFLSRLAERYAPLDPNVLWLRAQVLQQVYKMSEAYDVMQRAIALEPRNWSSFTADGGEIKVENKPGFVSQGWLPSGWLDYNAALPVSVSYSKVADLPEKAIVGFTMNVSQGSAELHGPRFICKRKTRCTIEGWVRSIAKSDLTIALCQFVESSDKLKEQTIRTTSEWTRFRVQFVPEQDTPVELRVYENAGSAIDLADITLKQE